MDQNIQDSSTEPEDSQDEDDESSSFVDDRSSEEIAAEGAAALAAEQQEAMMSDEDPDVYHPDQPASPLHMQDNLREEEVNSGMQCTPNFNPLSGCCSGSQPINSTSDGSNTIQT